MRERLLAPYLERFDVWADLAKSLDQVWASVGIDDAIEQLKWLRSPINTKDVVVGTENGRLLPLNAVPQQDRTSLVLTADMLGFRYYETNLLDTNDYLKLCRHLAEYYGNDKGTPVWTDFLGWCLNSHFKLYSTWTTDYQTFLLEGDPTIGLSIAEGGIWYPTTHVVLEYDQTRFQGIEPSQLVEFFNYFANVNLVLWMTQLGGTETISMKAAAARGSFECVYPGSV
jgi:hypothetical protein